MNATRSKKVRLAMKSIVASYADEVNRAAQDKFAMLNRNGEQQHLRISPRRLLKKMILREGLA